MSSNSPFNPVEADKAAKQQTDQERKPTRIISPEAILCFPYLFNPKKGMKPGDQPRFKATLLFRVHPEIDLRPLNELVTQAIFKKWGGAKPSSYRSPWRSGDEQAGKWPEFKGCIYISCSNSEQPGLRRLALPTDLQEMIKKGTVACNKDELYAGCIVRACLSASAYDGDTNRGVTFYLNSVLKVGDGKRLGGGRPAEDEFESFAATPSGAYSASSAYADVRQDPTTSGVMVGGVEIAMNADPDDTPF